MSGTNPATFRLGQREKFLLAILVILALLLSRYGKLMMEASFLHWAVREGSPLEVRLALLAGQAADRDANDGKNPFQIAVELNRLEMVKIMLESGVSPEQTYDSGLSPLAVAAGLGLADMVEVLLAGGADAELKVKSSSWRPLTGPQHLAARNGHLTILKRLMEGRRLPRYENIESSPYSDAIGSLRPEILDFLLTCRDPGEEERTIVDRCFAVAGRMADVPYLEYMLKKGATVESRDASGDTALHHAVSAGKRPNVEFLLARGLPVDSRGRAGETPIFRVSLWPEPDAAMLEILFAKGASPDTVGEYGGLLYHALNYRNQKYLDILLARGANPDVMWNETGTALHQAASWAQPEMARSLLRAKADVGARAPNGDTPLHVLGRYAYNSDAGAMGTASLLIEAGGALDARNTAGETILHTSAIAREKELLRYVLEKGAALGAVDLVGNTPLHAICASSDMIPRTVRNLLDAGAKRDAKNHAGMSPADVVRARGTHPRAKEVLEILASPR